LASGEACTLAKSLLKRLFYEDEFQQFAAATAT
jgi:hypothetical protein